uniref:Mitogen-activated protein kinase 11 n=1 Tax=Macaca mulatta TaxID=9544 RepID=H9FX69_MACMU
MSGPRAGF